MTKHPVALAIALAFATSAAVSGCDRTSSLTEQEHIQRAKDFEDQGKFKGSIVELKNAIQKNPDSPQARLLLGQIYLKVGMGAEAEKELTQAKKLGVNQETIKPQLGEALLLMGEYKRVLDEIQPGEQTSKSNLARILQLRADALVKLGQLQDACKLYQQSLDIDTNNPPTYWGLAQCSVAERNMSLARQWLDAALRIKDRQAKTWLIIGDLEQFNNDIEASIAAYSAALKIDPDNLEALRSRAMVNTSLGHLDLARIDMEKIHKLAPKSLAANYLQALFNFREGKYAEARDAVQEALTIAPSYVPALVLGGAIEYALNNFQTAESYLKKVVRVAPRNAYAVRMLAATQLRLGRPDDAANTLAPFDLEKVDDSSVLSIAGEIALTRREFIKAVSYFESAAEISPDNAAIRGELGLARLAQGDNRALADLQTAAGMDDSNTRADHVLILNQLNRRQFDDALASIAVLEKKLPQSPLPWNYRGMAYLGKKDVAKARASFEQGLKLDPKFLPAAVSLAHLDMLEKKPEAARKRLVSFLEHDKNNVKAMLALAGVASAEKNDREYIDWLEKAAKANPKVIEPVAGLVSHHLGKKENQKALARALAFSNSNQDSLQAINMLGATQMATGDYMAAIDTFNRMTLKAPQSPQAFLSLAEAQAAGKQLSPARVSLKRAIQLKPDFLQAQDALLRLEMNDNNPEAALKLARQIQAQQPKSPLGYEREADILLGEKHFLQAVKAYELALDRGASSARLIKLHRALILSGESKSAEQRLNAWIKLQPKDLAVRSYAAEFYLTVKQNRDAIMQYEEILKIDPRNALAYNNLASLYQRAKDNRALSIAEQAYTLAPDHPAVLDTLGWILVEQGKLPRAQELLNKAVNLAPKVASIRYHYGVALSLAGKKAEARNELEAAFAIGQQFPEIDEAKALLQRL